MVPNLSYKFLNPHLIQYILKLVRSFHNILCGKPGFRIIYDMYPPNKLDILHYHFFNLVLIK